MAGGRASTSTGPPPPTSAVGTTASAAGPPVEGVLFFFAFTFSSAFFLLFLSLGKLSIGFVAFEVAPNFLLEQALDYDFLFLFIYLAKGFDGRLMALDAQLCQSSELASIIH